jgi:Ca2+-binding EF-hand superfamily protein
LDKLEFEEMTSKLGVFMTTQELTCVYNHFDKNKDGKIAYDEFINAIRVRLNLLFAVIIPIFIVRHE